MKYATVAACVPVFPPGKSGWQSATLQLFPTIYLPVPGFLHPLLPPPQMAATTNAARFGELIQGGHGMDFAALSLKLPTGHDPDSKERRKALFRKCDVNGNGYLSLAEVDKAVGEAIGDEYLFSAKPVIAQAFAAAKDMRSGKSPDYVERSEFRLLLVYLRQYFELYVAYNRLDSSDDRRLSLPEFRKGVGLLAQWGIDLDEGEVEAEFARIDVNGGGIVLFDEFCDCKQARSPRVLALSTRALARAPISLPPWP